MAVTALLRRAVRRHAVVPLTAWVLVVALVASGVAFVNRDARTELEHRFRLRVAIASDFVATYVADLLARERVQALQFLAGPQVDQRAFEQSVAALGYPAAVLLDSGGAVLHIAPANPDLIGVDLRERYPHIRTALTDNRPAVSAVVPSVAAGVPVVSFAVPFETTSGRRIFAGAVDIRSSPLGAYLPHAIALAGSQVYLVDGDGTVVGSNQTVSGVHQLRDRAPALAKALAGRGDGGFADEHEQWRYDSAPVAGTSWRLVAAVRGGVLYQPVAETTIGGWIALGCFALFGLFGVALWARVARNRAALRASEERFRGERRRWEADQRRIRTELTARAADLEGANDALRAAQQRTADLVAMLSHDVRQPLGVITGYCELLLDGWEHLADAKKRREVGRVSRAGTAMMHLVEEVLTLTEIDEGGPRPRPGPIPMDEAVADAVAGLGTGSGAGSGAGSGTGSGTGSGAGSGAGPAEGIRVDVEPGVAVLADARHLQQILTNLLSNARKYGDGQVRVQVGRLDRAQVEICVADGGEGVPDDFVPHLFERFSRARSGVAPTRSGTGLGLYIVRELVEANGGTIRYEPNRPSGSRFVVELPADPARVRELNATA